VERKMEKAVNIADSVVEALALERERERWTRRCVAEEAAAAGGRRWVAGCEVERKLRREAEEAVSRLQQAHKHTKEELERSLAQLEGVRAERERAIAAVMAAAQRKVAELGAKQVELKARLGSEEARAAATEERLGMLRDRAEEAIRRARQDAVREAAAGAIRVSVVSPVVRLALAGDTADEVQVRAARNAVGGIADRLRAAVLRRFARVAVDAADAAWTDSMLRELEAAVEDEVRKHFE
jgi:chromosome segregation ATPase